MTNYSKSNPLSITIILLSVVALIGAIFLVGQKQETRRGAYFSAANLLIQPETITGTVGGNVPVQLWVNTENNSKVTSVDTKICYGDGLTLIDASDSMVTLNQEAFKLKAMVKVVDGCIRLAVGSGDIPTAELKSGMVRVATINFKGAKAGTGKLQMVVQGTTVGGYNPIPGATDISMKLGELKEATYTISDGLPSSDKYSRSTCNTTTGKYACSVSETGTYATIDECENSSGCEIETGEAPWLKFRMSFLGVTPGNECAEPNDMQLKVSVRAENGTMMTYENVVPVKVDNQGSLAFYDVKLKLVGFNYTDKIAVFVKGPKHLQGKYGVNNQSVYYAKAGGELTGLTYSEATTPVFNFEKYSLLAGDVTGPSAVQDGQIDGLDFSRVKTEAGKRTSVNNGGYLLTDLNGNCQMESQDLALLMFSLSVKQGQLY